MHIPLSATTQAVLLVGWVSGALGLPRADAGSELDLRALFPTLDEMNEIMLLDGPAFVDPAQNDSLVASVQAFAFLRQPNLHPLLSAAGKVLGQFGIETGRHVAQIESRLRLLGAIGLSGKNVDVRVQGCSDASGPNGERLGVTDDDQDGMVLGNMKLGECNKVDGELKGTTVIRSRLLGSDRTFENTIYASSPGGFGIISDIDDTVKITGTLDKAMVLRTTLIDQPEPVSGMPELYASLSKSLATSSPPAFFYVSGSPFQLYPFLRDFISASYSESKGPIFLQNLTVTDIPALLDFAKCKGIREYKLSMIERIHSFYPTKKFLMVGDSTQKDAETYGDAFRKFGGDFVACIWIRKVVDADNSDQRFKAAFKDVPQDRIRIYEDKDIEGLQSIDVKSGKC